MEQAELSFVEVRRTARYFKMNKLTSDTQNIWLVFHGYGQLAEYFIKHFKELDPTANFVIAPEGLSKFYVEGLTGRVGASWMTKQDREAEIEDQSAYINAVLRDCEVNVSTSGKRLIVLGFSQGTSTAIRWIAKNNVRPNELILWAGSFPHDVDAHQNTDLFKDLHVHFAYGNEDPFLKDVNIEEKTSEMGKAGMKLRIWRFDGKHVMDKPTLAEIVGSFEP